MEFKLTEYYHPVYFVTITHFDRWYILRIECVWFWLLYRIETKHQLYVFQLFLFPPIRSLVLVYLFIPSRCFPAFKHYEYVDGEYEVYVSHVAP